MRERLRSTGARVLVLGLCLGPVASARASEVGEYVAVNRPAPDGSAVRSSEQLAESAPGVQLNRYGASIHGATAFENSYRLDGLSTHDASTGANALPLSTEFISNVNIITSGYMAEYGRATGGIIETDLKVEETGQVQGALFGYWVPGVLSSRDASGTGPLKHLGDFGATLGGPLFVRQLYFFAGVAPALGRVEQTRTVQGTSRTFFADQRTLQAVAKVRYLVNPQHQLSLSFISTPSFSRGEGEPMEDEGASEAPRELDTQASSVRLAYTGGFFDQRMLLALRAGWLRQQAAPGDGGAGVDPGAMREQDQLQANGQLTYLASVMGYHVLKAGVDVERVTAELASTAERQILGGYVQDSWSLPMPITLSLGLRYDAQSLTAGAGARTVRLGGTLLPRLGVVMDPFRNGRAKVFAHVAKYQGLVPPGLLTSAARSVTVDPALVAPSSRELVAGFEFELLSEVRAGVSYTGRRLGSALQYLAQGEGTDVLLGNPGEGLASGTPEAKRSYDALTLAVEGVAGSQWPLRLSYTASRLRGNTSGLVPLPGAPGLAADTAPVELSASSGLLPADRTHTVKFYLSRDFTVSRRLNTNVGLSYLGASGRPREDGGRTAWANTVDVHLGAGYWLGPGSRLELSLDVFNILDVQEDAQWDGSTALRLQAPRQVRLGAKYMFF
ncbi:TonB-dependent receptor plug domain-containing protein [Pyxidicoccus sp. 3LFB2]